MSVLTVPDRDALILLEVNCTLPQQVTRSVWTKRRKVVGAPGAEVWSFKVAVEPLATEVEQRSWRAFWFGLRGQANTFNLPFCVQRHVGGKPTVDTGATAGYSIPLTGLFPSTRILSAGQYLTVPLPSGHARLAMLAGDLVSDAAGKATASLTVALNEIPALGATVETGNPYCPVALSQSSATLSYDNAVAGFGFDVEEAL